MLSVEHRKLDFLLSFFKINFITYKIDYHSKENMKA